MGRILFLAMLHSMRLRPCNWVKTSDIYKTCAGCGRIGRNGT